MYFNMLQLLGFSIAMILFVGMILFLERLKLAKILYAVFGVISLVASLILIALYSPISQAQIWIQYMNAGCIGFTAGMLSLWIRTKKTI